MSNGIDRLVGALHLRKALGLDNDSLFKQLEEYQQQRAALKDLRDSFQAACKDVSPQTLASMLQNGGIAAPGTMPAPDAGNCKCSGSYAAPRNFDFGASGDQDAKAVDKLFDRVDGALFERFLQQNPFARQQIEMMLGGRVVPDSSTDGRIAIQPFPNGAFPAGGGGDDGRFTSAAGILDQLQRGAGSADASAGGQSDFHNMMLGALGRMFVAGQPGNGQTSSGGSHLPRTPGGGSPFVEWFGPPGNPQQAAQNGQGGQVSAMTAGGGGGSGAGSGVGANFSPFSAGTVGPHQDRFGIAPTDGSDVAGVLNDPGLTVEDKVTLMIMLIMNKMDKDIEKKAQEINKLQQQQNAKEAAQKSGATGAGATGTGAGGTGAGASGADGVAGSEKSIDIETMKLKRLVDKRSQMFDMLRQIIDKYNQTAKGIIDSIGR